MIRRIGALASQRTASRGSRLRHPDYALDADVLRRQAANRLDDTRATFARSAIRRVVEVAKFRKLTNGELFLIGRNRWARVHDTAMLEPEMRGYLRAYGVDPSLLDRAVAITQRLIALA